MLQFIEAAEAGRAAEPVAPLYRALHAVPKNPLGSLTFEALAPLLIHSSASALRRRLSVQPVVQGLRAANDAEMISDSQLRKQVDAWINQAHEANPHELQMAALAVALEGQFSAFATEYLRGCLRMLLSESFDHEFSHG